jgi:hypothetical protein
LFNFKIFTIMGNSTNKPKGNDEFQVPDTIPGQVPDSIPEPVPMPEPEEKDEPGRPGPMPGPSGFSLR